MKFRLKFIFEKKFDRFQLDVGCQIYARGKQQEMEALESETNEINQEEENKNNVAQTVGHNMYILTYQVGHRLIDKLISISFLSSFSSLVTIASWKHF